MKKLQLHITNVKKKKTKTFSITHLFLSSDWINNRSKAVLQSIVVNTTPPPFPTMEPYLGHHDKIWTLDMVCSCNIGNWKEWKVSFKKWQ